jgi:heme/copper-type cytochrome/quinol oxidase subunit 2
MMMMMMMIIIIIITVLSCVVYTYIFFQIIYTDHDYRLQFPTSPALPLTNRGLRRTCVGKKDCTHG